MKIIAQSLILFSLGHLASSQHDQSYLRRRAKAAKQTDAPEFKSVKPLLAEDVIQLNPSATISAESGITLNNEHYTASDAVEVDFEVSPQYYVNSEVSPNVTRVDEWTVGIYMHMSDPQGGALPPIVSLRPEFEYGRDESMTGSVTFSKSVVHLMDGSDPMWPLETVAYGIAFDVWLLDEVGAAIIGPEWFTLEPDDTELNGFMEMSEHPLAEYGHADLKQEFEVNEIEEPASTFALSTDKTTYTADEKIQVSYTIGEVPTPTEDTDMLIMFNPPAIEDEPVKIEHQGLFDELSDSDADFDPIFAPQEIKPSAPSFTISIYMKMARPQNGKLDPIVAKSIDSKTGKVQFDASSLDTLLYGTGFDAWIVDENGSEVFGPVFFSIPDPDDEEAPIMTSY
jgi:hypothetical protein